MKISPVLTEKSFANAKEGFYTFWVEKDATKKDIKRAIEEAFDIHVTSVRTINFKADKKAIVTLKGDEKIDLFEEKKAK